MVISSLVTALCLGIGFWHWSDLVSMRMDTLRFWIGLLPLALVAGAALFVVRGYAITPDAILVRRLLWTIRVSRSGFQSARFEPEALRRSIRICGNGGFFSFTGWFRSPTLGSYRAFATDPSRAVVLRFSDRTVVLTPVDPEAFIHALSPSDRSA